MDKILIEISNGTVTNVRSTNNDISIHLIDHDLKKEGFSPIIIEGIYMSPIDYHGCELSQKEFDKALDDISTDEQ